MQTAIQSRVARGSLSYHAGLAAEEIVMRHYAGLGCTLAAQRWRGQAGEIDLVFRGADGLVFVEVKSSTTFEAAARLLRPAQRRRLCLAACEYLAGEPAGQLTPMRLDVALVDGAGNVHVLENALTDG